MALNGKIICRGVVIEDAYLRVCSVNYDNTSKTACATLTLHSGKDEKPLPLDYTSVVSGITVSDGVIVEEVYEHIKKIPEYAHMIDC